MGTLFAELCHLGADDFERSPEQLLDYKAHRFLGLTRVVRRILRLWDALVVWYDERLTRAQRDGKEPPSAFPLSHEHENLMQLLSLLEPITALNRRGQSESANQVEVLLTMFQLRLTTLNITSALRDYRSTVEKKLYFRPDQLTTITNTRSLLQSAFQQNFFSRYMDRQKMMKCSFVLEIQLFLHPNFKNLDGVLKDVIVLCNTQQGSPKPTAERNFQKVKSTVVDKVRALMRTVIVSEVDNEPVLDFPPPPPVVFSEGLMELFSNSTSETVAPEQQQDLNDSRVDEELQRWILAPTTLRRAEEGKAESVLSYLEASTSDQHLQAATSCCENCQRDASVSAQIERDFGTAGRMVMPQRSSIVAHNVDMSIFLSCNRECVDLTQCEKIDTDDISSRISGNVLVPMDPDDDMNYEEMTNGYFSCDSTNEEQSNE